jgi:hypothetical protein
MGYGLGRSNFDCRQSKGFLFTPQRPDWLWDPGTQWVPKAVSPAVKRCEADHSLQSNAEVKNGGAVPSLPDKSSWLVAQLIMYTYNFTVYIYTEHKFVTSASFCLIVFVSLGVRKTIIGYTRHI